MSESVGDVMSEGRNRALKTLAIGAGILVYLGMVVYSGVHNWRLMMAGVGQEMQIWAAMGVIGLELSAVFLPIALHWWTHAPLQRFAAFAFYALDLALIFLNVVLDYAVVAGSSDIPGWLQTYLFFVVPATPVIAGLGWSILFLLDPSQRERAMIETLRASTREALGVRIAQQAKSADIAETVDLAAANMARDIVAATLGTAVSRTSPSDTIDAKARDPEKRQRVQARSVIWPRKMRRPESNGREAYAAETEAASKDDFLPGDRL